MTISYEQSRPWTDMSSYYDGLPSLPDHVRVPDHVAIVMDGNGRWAQEKGLPVSEGHGAGAEALRKLCYVCHKWGISTLTVYAFSTENWRRSPEEVEAIMALMIYYLELCIDDLHNIKARFTVLGDISCLEEKLQGRIRYVEEATMMKPSEDQRLRLNVAFNYGGRAEICRAIQEMTKKVACGDLDADAIDEEVVGSYLYTHGQRDPDLFIRPGGEYRISNFLLWQMAYAELFFTPCLWPDFDHTVLQQAIEDYASRQRRFGTRPAT